MAPNDPRDDTVQHPADTWDTLPANLRPVHDLLHDVSASWQRQLPSADALNAQLPHLLRDADGEHSPRQRGDTAAELRERRGVSVDGGGGAGRISGPVPSPAARSMHRWLSAVAALLLIALGASVFGVFAAHRPSSGTTLVHPTATPTSTPTPTVPPITRVLAPQPQNTRLPLPPNGAIGSLSFSSATDGWAGGSILIPDVQGADWSASQGYLVHYHNGQWTRSAETYPRARIAAVSMVSTDEGWAIGATDWDPVTNANGHDFLLHYTGGHWHNLGAFVPQDTFLTELHMSGAGWGYATGSADVPIPGQSSVKAVLVIAVYQAGTWRVIQTSFPAYSTFAVMVSPDEGWAAGPDDRGLSELYHYLRGTWTSVTLLDGVAYGLSMASPQDIWALGVKCMLNPTPSAVYPNGQLCLLNPSHFDGTTWSLAPSPDPLTLPAQNSVDTYEMFADETGAAWIAIMSTVQNPASPNASQYTSELYRFANGHWSSVVLPVSNVSLPSVVSDHNGGTWALAYGIHPDKGYCLYYDGAAWRVYGRWLAA